MTVERVRKGFADNGLIGMAEEHIERLKKRMAQYHQTADISEDDLKLAGVVLRELFKVRGTRFKSVVTDEGDARSSRSRACS